MKILYRQSGINCEKTSLEQVGVKNCYLKEIIYDNDYKITTLKSHCHTEYEIHMVFCGKQCYEMNGKVYEIEENEFLLIPPKTKHKIVFSSENLLKYPITFNSDCSVSEIPFVGHVTDSIAESILFILEEFKQKAGLSAVLIENRVFEILVMIFRIAGYKVKNEPLIPSLNDGRIELAKKFISDNIERNLSVKDVAAYCHFSTRQLTRDFLDAEEIPPGKYILRERMNKICELIKNTDLSLQQISGQFSFNNEYYFNSVFKKFFGMPPLAYRKMFKK